MPEQQISVLLIEDNEADVRFFQEMLKEGKDTTFLLVHRDRLSTGPDYVRENRVDVIFSDLGLPDSQGLDTFLALQSRCAQIPVIVLTSLMDDGVALNAVQKGAQDYLLKRNISSDILVRSLRYAIERKRMEEERDRSIERLRKALGATVQAIASIVERRDPYTAGHQRRVADLARSIAKELSLSADQTDGLRMASTIHDIGKISVPAEILSKPSKLTDVEFGLIKVHPQAGYDILKDIDFPWPIARMVLEHHERMDGSGYPQGLKGADLLIESRILCVADVVEAIASHRPYRPGLGIDIALEEISKDRATLYDPEVVGACLRLFREKGYMLDNISNW